VAKIKCSNHKKNRGSCIITSPYCFEVKNMKECPYNKKGKK